MKKIFLIIIFLIGLKNFSYSQFAGKGGSEKSGSFFSRIFRGGQKPLKQTQHFGKQKKEGAWEGKHFQTQNGCGFFALGIGQSPRGVRQPRLL